MFLCSWKIANVLPLFKKDDPTELSNYRPVSLLSCVGKIMERIVFKHMYIYFFNDNNLFYKYQAGFLPGHSTVYQLIETNDCILKAIDEGKVSCVFFAICLKPLIGYGTRDCYLNFKHMAYMAICLNG